MTTLVALGHHALGSLCRSTSSTPPGMSSAAASVRESPITRNRYGEVSSVPSTSTRLAALLGPSEGSTKDVLATTRTAGPSNGDDLDRLGAGVAQLLQGVEQDVGADLALAGR